MKAEAFIIHLARARGRAPQVERLRQSLPLPVTVIDAVDAQELESYEIAGVCRPKLHRPHYPFRLRTTEIACFLSHRKAWQTILDRGLDAGLLVEDDVELEPAFSAALKLALANAKAGDFIRFPKRARERGRLLAGEGGMSLLEPRHVGLGMQAQLVGRDAARMLLAATETFDRPVDTTIQMRWLHDVRILSTMPIAIREVAIKLGGTTVQEKEKPLVEILSREFSRSLYRFAVKLHNVLKGSRKAVDGREG